MKRLNRFSKKEKGITLVALIITIVVLLILALVTINAVRGDGIIGKAQKAKEEYQKKSDEEKAVLEEYLGFLEENLPGGSSSDGTQDANQSPQIGDKVEYNEGYGKTSTVDSNFVMKDMEWRILDIEDDGRIELISTQQTDSELTISGEAGLLNAENDLNKLCNDLYANGEGVTARSLRLEDIDKLAGIINEEDKKSLGSTTYGNLWRYKYDEREGKIQYSKSIDNGETWTSYANTKYSKFKELGKQEINSTNMLEIVELRTNAYSYIMEQKITATAKDGISILSLIGQGMKNGNNEVSEIMLYHWLATPFVYCEKDHAGFGLYYLNQCDLRFDALWISYGYNNEISRAVRPVVTLPSNVTLTNVDGSWQVNI